MQLFQKQKTFSEFFAEFLKSWLNCEHFGKKMTLIYFVFPKLRTPKSWLDKYLKNSSFRGPSEKQNGKRAVIQLKSAPQHLYHIYWSLLREFSWKKSLLMICQILRLFPNI